MRAFVNTCTRCTNMILKSLTHPLPLLLTQHHTSGSSTNEMDPSSLHQLTFCYTNTVSGQVSYHQTIMDCTMNCNDNGNMAIVNNNGGNGEAADFCEEDGENDSDSITSSSLIAMTNNNTPYGGGGSGSHSSSHSPSTNIHDSLNGTGGNSSMTMSKKRGCFPKNATNKLKHWLFQHVAVWLIHIHRSGSESPPLMT